MLPFQGLARRVKAVYRSSTFADPLMVSYGSVDSDSHDPHHLPFEKRPHSRCGIILASPALPLPFQGAGHGLSRRWGDLAPTNLWDRKAPDCRKAWDKASQRGCGRRKSYARCL